MSGDVGARRLGDAIVAFGRIVNSRRLDARRAEQSGVPLSMVASNVLRHVVEHGPLRPGALAERARMQPTALSRQLGILERDGAITRVPDPFDGRGSLVKATPRGRAHARKVRNAEQDLIAGQLAAWSDRDVDTLARLLERLVHDLRAPDPVPLATVGATPPGRRTVPTSPSASRRRSA